MNNEILKLFPEPVFKYKFDNYEDINKELTKYIYKLYDEDNNGVERSNRGGWHSKNFRLSEKDSVQQKFAIKVQDYILNCFQNFGWKTKDKNIRIKEMWAIINKKNDFNVIHTHPNCYLSAAYYVKAPKNCGNFKTSNPNIINRNIYPKPEKPTEFNSNNITIKINEGDLLIFPAYLPHSVEENKSNEDRVIISFNLDILR